MMTSVRRDDYGVTMVRRVDANLFYNIKKYITIRKEMLKDAKDMLVFTDYTHVGNPIISWNLLGPTVGNMVLIELFYGYRNYKLIQGEDNAI